MFSVTIFFVHRSILFGHFFSGLSGTSKCKTIKDSEHTHLYRVPFTHDSDVTLAVALRSTVDVIRVCQHRPFVVKLMLCQQHNNNNININITMKE
jgi:hypothetical protein